MIIPPGSDLEKIRPKLIPSLRAGFEAIANNIWLILLPVVLDVSLWIAPHLQIKTVMQPLVDSMNELAGKNPQQMANLPSAQEIWQILLDRFNLVFALRTFPIGIPSLLVNWMPVDTPFGKAMGIEMSNAGEIVTWWIVFVLVGLIISSIYFGEISRITAKTKEEPLTPGVLGWITLQLLTLTGLVVVIGTLFGLPALLVISAITMLNQSIGFLALFLGGMALIWLIVPVMFSAHGIFTNHLPVFRSIAVSIQVVRISFSSTGLFLLVCVVLSQGLNMLWEVPPENSWLLLVGIMGHAFISTGLIAASFYFFRDGLQFFQTVLAKAQMVQPSSPEVIK